MSPNPARRLHPQAYAALTEALSTFQWYKADFKQMVTALFAGEPAVLAGIDLEQRKRVVAQEVVGRLQRDERRYQAMVIGVLMSLADYDPDFPHLARLADSEDKVEAARHAHDQVRAVIGDHKAIVDSVDARQAADAAANARAAKAWHQKQDLATLKTDLYQLNAMGNPQQRGLALETLLNRLFALFDLDPRAAFVLKGEQIDGAFTHDTNDYLLEARWRKAPVDPDQVRSFAGKVAEKSHVTLGLMLSINGFTSEACKVLERTSSRLLLADGADLSAVLEGAISLDELLLRKRRHLTETGSAYLLARLML